MRTIHIQHFTEALVTGTVAVCLVPRLVTMAKKSVQIICKSYLENLENGNIEIPDLKCAAFTTVTVIYCTTIIGIGYVAYRIIHNRITNE